MSRPIISRNLTPPPLCWVGSFVFCCRFTIGETTLQAFFFSFLWLTISLSHIRMAFNLHFSHALRLAEQSVHIWIIVWILHLISLCFTSCALNLGKILRPLTVNRTSADFTACDVSCYGDSIINIFPSLTVLWFLQAYVWRIDVFPSGRWSTHNIEARNNSWRDPCQQEDIYRSLFHG